MRDLMNRGRQRKVLPDLTDKRVEFVSCTPTKDPHRWIATLNVNGWPHDIRMWAKDELDVMKKVLEMRRGEHVVNAFDISK
jgi:hypothetical protein